MMTFIVYFLVGCAITVIYYVFTEKPLTISKLVVSVLTWPILYVVLAIARIK